MSAAKPTKQLHVSTSPITGRIFAGHVLKDGYTWAANKTDVTGEACGAVAHHVLIGAGMGATKGGATVSVNGKPVYRITVEKLEGANDR